VFEGPSEEDSEGVEEDPGGDSEGVEEDPSGDSELEEELEGFEEDSDSSDILYWYTTKMKYCLKHAG